MIDDEENEANSDNDEGTDATSPALRVVREDEEPATQPKRPKLPQHVYGVHAIKAREICSTKMVTADLADAQKYAADISTDPGVLAAAVTRFVLGAIGQGTPIFLYVNKKLQDVPYVSNDRRINASGHGSGSRLAGRP
jgi:hypothetical protein